MTKARVNADNVAGDISGVTAGTGLSGGGTSGTVTISADTAVVATTNNTLTMSGKTLTAPRFASAGEIDDANGNELIKFPATVASAINEITVTNATTSGTPSISATGDDTNISLNLVPKGTGTVQAGGVAVATTSGTQTLTNKTLSGAALTGTLTAGGGVGSNGQVLQSTGSGVQWGSAGLTWTQRIQPLTNQLNSIAYNGSNLYVVAGQSGALYTSPDGITWTSRTSGFGSNNISKVHWASGLSLWIAVGGNGTITTSSDGTTWTARTANFSTNTISDVASSGTTVVAVGQGGGSTNTGGITYSSDGITWTRKSQTPAVGTSYNSVAYNGTNWVVATASNINNALYASTPSGTWNTVSLTGGNATQAIIWDGTRHFIFTNGPSVLTTTSVTLASDVTIQNGFTRTQTNATLFLYSGRIYGLADSLNNQPYFLLDHSTSISANASNYVADVGAPTLPPAATRISPTSQWVGAAGRIICADNGLYTSF